LYANPHVVMKIRAADSTVYTVHLAGGDVGATPGVGYQGHVQGRRSARRHRCFPLAIPRRTRCLWSARCAVHATNGAGAPARRLPDRREPG
jgi:hypothetical protein